jgi:hypothetical protein
MMSNEHAHDSTLTTMPRISILTNFILAAAAAVPGNSALAVSAPYATASLPPDMLQQAAAETCPALRSGTYRMISPTLGGTLADQTGKAVLDAAKLTFTRPDGSRGTWEAQGNCRFTDPGTNGYSVDYVVSPAGILVGRITVNGGSSFRNVMGFPEQPHALAELAGTWNLLGLRASPEGFYADGGTVTYDRMGVSTGAMQCGSPSSWAVDACSETPASALEAVMPFVEDATGGFVSKSGTPTRRLFLYRSGTGLPMLAGIASDGAFFVGTPVEAMDMPAAGLSTHSWNLDMTGRLASATSTYAISSVTVSSDAKLGSWVRKKQNIGLPDEHLETLLANKPRNGYFTRPAGESSTGSGSAQHLLHFNELVALNLPGKGFNVLVLPAVKLFEFSVIQP